MRVALLLMAAAAFVVSGCGGNEPPPGYQVKDPTEITKGVNPQTNLPGAPAKMKGPGMRPARP